MSESQPSDDFLDGPAPSESPAAEAAPSEDASAVDSQAPPVESAPAVAPAAPVPSTDEQESALTPPGGEQVDPKPQEIVEQAKARAEELRVLLGQLRSFQDSANAELRELEKLVLKYELPPPLHLQNAYAQRLDQSEYQARAESADLLAMLAQRLQKKTHPLMFSLKTKE